MIGIQKFGNDDMMIEQISIQRSLDTVWEIFPIEGWIHEDSVEYTW